jgi:hypothetical protein
MMPFRCELKPIYGLRRFARFSNPAHLHESRRAKENKIRFDRLGCGRHLVHAALPFATTGRIGPA